MGASVDPLKPCLAILPARGGSKGLPGKNIRPLAGLPLLVHSLRFVSLAQGISRVVVSTDSEEIASVARAAGGDVPFLRPKPLAADDAPLMPVLTHALAEVERTEGRRYGSVLLLDPTSPFRLPEDLARAFEILLADPRARGVVACSEPTFNPFFNGVVERGGYLTPAFSISSGALVRRQEAPRFLRVTGTLYLWRSEFVRSGPRTWTEDCHRVVEIPEVRAFSIDDQFQFDVAELFLAARLVVLPWLEV